MLMTTHRDRRVLDCAEPAEIIVSALLPAGLNARIEKFADC
jgi:hypothetical protein